MDKTAALPRTKAYSYIRMSTDLQLKGDSLRRQREASQRYADRYGLQLVEEFDLQDIGYSGYDGENIASGSFGRFLKAVRAGEIEKGSYLLVESFDRMSRQEPMRALKPFMEIVEAGLVLVTLDDERVFSGKISFEDLIISIAKMSRANEESVRKSDRLSKAWQNKRKEAGTKKLTARCPSWLRLLDGREAFEIIEDRARIVRRMFDEAVAGLGAYSIVRRLNDDGIPTFAGKAGWQTSTVNKIIGSKSVIGEFQPSRMVNGKRSPEGDPRKGYFPRIIDDEKFYAAQRGRLERRTAGTADRKGSGGAKGKRLSNLFSKLAVCDNCASPMQYQNKGAPPKGQSYLVCSNAIRKHGCHVAARWRYDHFETMFLSFVEKLDLASIVSTEQQDSKQNDLSRQLESLAGRERSIEGDLERLLAVLKEGNQTSDFLARKFAEAEAELGRVKSGKVKVQAELAALEATSLGYYTNQAQMSDLID
ncbi:recombinase family protein, partial [Bradyrhizobium sp.]|uniref:recombinase family protein n=1 Tax=Bradyrhizobium sp. TaxID=376 RepID=UPI00273604A7